MRASVKGNGGADTESLAGTRDLSKGLARGLDGDLTVQSRDRNASAFRLSPAPTVDAIFTGAASPLAGQTDGTTQSRKLL